MKKILLLLLLIISASVGYSQKAIINGVVWDTLNKQPLENAVISLIRNKDSILYKFTRTAKDGSFTFSNLLAGKYTLQISYPTYANYTDEIELAEETVLNLKQLPLITRANLLQEVIVKQKIAAIRIKGDTTEYLADSFKVKANATAEDLLKKLPGISVNSKGVITAQGQTVQKVLVDGDEFFGDDPTMATQNLNAKDVARVQVFDKKSDNATLTGIDDGQKQKTVNLILKDDAKKGYFGKAEGGTDFNKYYQGKFTVSRFTSTLKAGILSTADRTGRNGMSWDEAQDFGNVTTTFDGGNVSMNWEGDEFDSYNSEGIPENFSTAAMLNKKFGKLKSNTTNNFSYKHQNNVGTGYTTTQYILPDTVYFNNQNRDFTNRKTKQSFSTRNEFNIDSATTISINANGSWSKNNVNNLFNSEFLTDTKIAVNKNFRTNSNISNNNTAKADIFLKRKLNKKGRSITLSTGFAKTNSNGEGFLLNTTNFYKDGILNSSQIIDQQKINISETKSINALASYIEPLSKRVMLNINYTYGGNMNNQDTRSFEKRNGKYDSLNLLFSNNFKFENTSHKVGFSINYSSKKLTLRTGLAMQDLALKQTNLFKDSSFARRFTNFFPTANINWKFSSSGGLYLNYNGSTQQPSLTQLQPIVNNNDPLNLTIGNANLKPAFVHSFYLNGNSFKVLSQRNIYGYGNFSFTQNAFGNRDIVDSLGRRTFETVNVNGNYYYSTGIHFNKKIKFFNLNLGLGIRLNGNNNVGFVNGFENITKSYGVGPNLRVNKYVEKKYDFGFEYSPQFSNSKSSINTDASINYWIHNIEANFNWRFAKGWVFETDIQANLREKINSTDRNNNATIWDARVEKKLFKKKDITAIISVFDILNQKIGFRRNINSNFITENTFTTVQRYALLSIRWKFAKNRKINNDDDD